MNYRGEIGSEYWKNSVNRKSIEFFLTGRTALEYIIQDILSNHQITSVRMPSYCCHTMIEPFTRHGLQVEFYDVYFENQKLKADIPEAKKNQILFYISYFGFYNEFEEKIHGIRNGYEVVIEDTTHSFLREKVHKDVDYTFTSYRKWNGFTGIATASKEHGEFKVKIDNKFNIHYDALREEAFLEKSEFMQGNTEDKDSFLRKFGEAEEHLESNYLEYRPSYDSLRQFAVTDWETIAQIRRENAKVLIEGLSRVKEIEMMFDKVRAEDAPLFVPIIVKGQRDGLRRFLIERDIYCPVHWPLSVLHEGISEKAKSLYQSELSIICDQRYGSEQMQIIIETIEKYYRSNDV